MKKMTKNTFNTKKSVGGVAPAALLLRNHMILQDKMHNNGMQLTPSTAAVFPNHQ